MMGLTEMCRVTKKGGRLLMLEHVKSSNWLVGGAMEKLNPVLSIIDNINRGTVANVQEAGWSLVAEKNLLGDIVKQIIAKK